MKRLPLLLVVLILVTSSLAQVKNAEEKRLPVIDMHLHAIPTTIFGAPIPENPATGKPSTARNDQEVLSKTLEEMKRHNVVKAITSGPLELVERWRNAAPDRIVGAAMFPMFTPAPDLEKTRALIREGKLGALGEITSQYAGLPPGSAELEPYFALAEELDIPVGIHMGIGPPGASYNLAPKYRASLGNPLLLEEVVVRHPRLRIYVMHAGWPFLEEMMALLHAHPQVYADLAVIDWIPPRKEFHEYLRRLVQAGYGERLMFGSDQMLWPESIGMAIEGIESASFLTTPQKRDILCNNAARFLRLDVQKSCSGAPSPKR